MDKLMDRERKTTARKGARNKKDILQKALESYNDVYADIVNGLIFGGRKVMLEETLERARLRSYYEEEGGIREQERDVGKY